MHFSSPKIIVLYSTIVLITLLFDIFQMHATSNVLSSSFLTCFLSPLQFPVLQVIYLSYLLLQTVEGFLKHITFFLFYFISSYFVILIVTLFYQVIQIRN